jgi:hypothetical protein
MDKVLVAGLLTIAGIITAVVLFGGLTSSIQEASDNTKKTVALSTAQQKSGIKILQVLVSGSGSELKIWAKNTGSNEIKPLDKLDLFLMDIDGIWGDYLTYSPTASISQNTWRVASPANLNWNPGDTFELLASLPIDPITRKSYNLSISTPDLFTDEYRFDTQP